MFYTNMTDIIKWIRTTQSFLSTMERIIGMDISKELSEEYSAGRI